MSSRAAWLRFLLPVVLCLFLFWPLIFNGYILGFRDSLHFYYPLWRYQDTQPLLQWLLPPFNYFDRAGVSVIAEPTGLSFYPPRLLLRLPFFGLEQSIGLFLSFHVLIAWYATYWCSRKVFYRSTVASSIAASAYTFGCATYFYIYNPPYLISAAWLPLAVGHILRILKCRESNGDRTRHSNSYVWFPLVIAAMILGGDFQLPYNIALVTFASIVSCLSPNSIRSERTFAGRSSLKSHILKAFWLFFLFALGVGIASIQWLPTWYWLRSNNIALQVSSRGIDDLYTLRWLDFFDLADPFRLGKLHTNAYAMERLVRSGIDVDAFHLFGNSRVLWVHRFVLRIQTSKDSINRICRLDRSGIVSRTVGRTVYSHCQCITGLQRFSLSHEMVCNRGSWFIGTRGICNRFCNQTKRHCTQARSNRNSLGCDECADIVRSIDCQICDSNRFHRRSARYALRRLFERACGSAYCGYCGRHGICFFLIAWLLSTSQFGNHKKKFVLVEFVTVVHLVFCAWMVTTTIDPNKLDNFPSTSAEWQTAGKSVPVLWQEKMLADSPAENPAIAAFVANPRSAIEAARFQQSYGVGKFHLLQPVRSLRAQLSVEPSWYVGEPKIAWVQHSSNPPNLAGELSVQLLHNAVTIDRKNDAPMEVTLPIIQDGGWTISDSQATLGSSSEHLLVIRLPSSVGHVKLTYFTPGLKLVFV